MPKSQIRNFHCQACAHKWRESFRGKMPCCPECRSDHTQFFEPEGGEQESETETGEEVGPDRGSAFC